MHDGLYLAAPDLLGAATLGERGDGSNGLSIGWLLEDRLEVPVQAAELGSKLLLRRGTPRGDPLRRLFLEMAQEEPQQVPGLPRRDGWCFSRVRRLRGFRPARLQVPEGAGQIVTHCGTRSEEHTSELQSRQYLVCRLLLEKKKKNKTTLDTTKRK